MYSLHVTGLIQSSKEAFQNFVNSFKNNYYTENFNKLHEQKIAFIKLQTANNNTRSLLQWLNEQIQTNQIVIEGNEDKSFQKRINNLTAHSFYTSNFLAVYKNYLNSKQQMLRNQENFRRTTMFTILMGIALLALIMTAPIIPVICVAAITMFSAFVTFKYARVIISKPPENLEKHIGTLPNGTKGNLAVLFNACRDENQNIVALDTAIKNMENEEEKEEVKEYSFDNVTHLELIEFVGNILNNISEFVSPYTKAHNDKKQELINEMRTDERCKYPQTFLYDELMTEQSFPKHRDPNDIDEEQPLPEPITINSKSGKVVDRQWGYCSFKH